MLSFIHTPPWSSNDHMTQAMFTGIYGPKEAARMILYDAKIDNTDIASLMSVDTESSELESMLDSLVESILPKYSENNQQQITRAVNYIKHYPNWRKAKGLDTIQTKTIGES